MPGSASKTKQKNYLFGDSFINELEVEAKDFWMRFLALNFTPNDYKLKVIVNVGKQGFGKTTLMDYLNWVISSIPQYKGMVNCAMMKDLRTLYNPKYQKYWELPVQVLNFEDAAKIFDSYEFLKNRKKTSDYFDLRHIYKEECHYGEYGIIFMIVNIQTLRRLDVNIRDTYDVLVLKNYYDTKWFNDIVKSDDLKEFARDFTENASAFCMEEEKRFCLGKTLGGREFKWSIPIEDVDPGTGETERISELLRKYDLVHEFGIDTLEQRVLARLQNRLLYHDYFELKTQKQLRGWLKRIAKKKYEIEKYRIEFSNGQLNDLIETVSDLRFHINLDKKEEFFNFLQKKISEVNLETTSFNELLIMARKETRDKKLFFLKDKDLQGMIKEILLYPTTNSPSISQETTIRPGSNLDKVVKALKIRGIANINTIAFITELNNNIVRGILSDYRYLFVNLAKNKGIYCLKEYQPFVSQQRIDEIVGKKVVKKLTVMIS